MPLSTGYLSNFLLQTSFEIAQLIHFLSMQLWPPILYIELQYFGHLMQRADSLENPPMLGKTEGKKRRGWQKEGGWMASSTQRNWVWANSEDWRTGKPGVLQSLGSQRVGHDWATEQQQHDLQLFSKEDFFGKATVSIAKEAHSIINI